MAVAVEERSDLGHKADAYFSVTPRSMSSSQFPLRPDSQSQSIDMSEVQSQSRSQNQSASSLQQADIRTSAEENVNTGEDASRDRFAEGATPSSTEREIPSLPNVDTSREAWAYVVAGFVMEMLLWGPMFSSAVFLKYYAASPEFQSASEASISAINTTQLLFGYSMGFPLLYFYNRFPRQIKPSIWAGIILYTCSMLAASFVKSVNLLILFQGVGPGIAGAFTAFPIIRWLPEWFDKRKGTAGGIVFSGGGVGGVYMPFLYQYLIDRLGYQWTLRISAISTAVAASIAIYFVNPRVPIPAKAQFVRAPMPPLVSTFMRYGFFGCFFGTLLQAFGFFNVNLFLPRFSDTLGATAGAGLLSAFNVCVIIAQVLWGLLTDKMRPTTAMALSSILGSILVLTIWGFGGATGLPVLAPFAVLFGLMTGGFTSMWFQTAYNIAGPDKEQQTLLVSGFSIARGVGAVLGPTIGSDLYRLPSTPGGNRWGSAGSPGLVGFVAASLAGSAIVAILFMYADRIVAWFTSIAKIDEGSASATRGRPSGRRESQAYEMDSMP
ncbi:hypothetical protein I316_06003 [Kwoniella heveanensis BCC8398]|uniref:Major facilitator superfamily (MFS) profile domain-containing protein n=1 Tax=Kwoniella heveanensis BCC8398 TaxID=1296120 RepID=A0A1B9GNA3_9TREE|nr:hypothetical protein I316_06003 [Kwoniella heveanensis BCC8398]